MLPIAGINNLCRDRQVAFLCQFAKLSRKVFRIDGWSVQRNAVGNDMNVDQPQSDVEITGQAGCILQGSPREVCRSVRYDDLQIG